jgi:hypothetical protein
MLAALTVHMTSKQCSSSSNHLQTSSLAQPKQADFDRMDIQLTKQNDGRILAQGLGFACH